MEVPQEDGAGTDNYYNSGEISVFTWGSPENQSEFLLAVQMDLEDFSFRPSHLSNTPDIIALSHDHPDFIPVGDPEIWATPDESGEFHETSWFSGSTDGDGLVGRVEFETGVSHMPYPDDLRIGMATSLVWEGNTIPRVWGSYQHTASILSNSVDSVSLGVGGISIDFSGNVEIHDVADWANP